ncbi:MAG: response regulator [Candidatus Saccharimonadales bacterium]
MTKVMLVEDDNNLREIYEARLTAEGYTIVAAHDGEEALALAVKEKPDLIISDVMMPKISGFDMLDILRSTPETRNAKVIMMTALSQAEDRQRADKLGADRYLVKSQVTLEDVIKTAHDVLGDTPGAAPEATPAEAPATTPVAAAPAPSLDPTPVPAPAVVPQPTAAAEPAPEPTPAPAPDPTPAPASTDSNSTDGDNVIADNPTLSSQATVAPVDSPEDNSQTVAATAPEVPSPGGISGSTADVASPAPSGQAIAEPAAMPKSIPITVSSPGDTIQPAATPAPTAEATAIPVVDATPATETTPEAAPAAETAPAPQDKPAVNITAPSHQKLVLQPTGQNLSSSVDLDALLAKEEASDNQDKAVQTPSTSTVITPASGASEGPADQAPGQPNDQTAGDEASQIAL